MAVLKKIKYSILYRFVQFLIFFSNALPRKTWLKTCGLLGIFVYALMGKMRRLTKAHLTLVFGESSSPTEIGKLSRKVFEMLGKNAGEMLRATRVETLADIQKFMITEGLENFTNAEAKGKGVIFMSCHVGAFDLQVSNMALRGHKTYVIGTPLKDERLNNLLWKYRHKYGAVPIARGKETFRLFKVLKSGGSIAILIDQDTKVKSRFVNFFGKPASTPIGATVLAMKTGAPVVPTLCLPGQRLEATHGISCRKSPCGLPVMMRQISCHNTQVMTNCIEDIIRQHPEQWVWMHERWKTQPGEEISVIIS